MILIIQQSRCLKHHRRAHSSTATLEGLSGSIVYRRIFRESSLPDGEFSDSYRDGLWMCRSWSVNPKGTGQEGHTGLSVAFNVSTAANRSALDSMRKTGRPIGEPTPMLTTVDPPPHLPGALGKMRRDTTVRALWMGPAQSHVSGAARL